MTKNLETDLVRRPTILFLLLVVFLGFSWPERARTRVNAAATAPIVAATGQELSAAGVASLRNIIDTAHQPDLRWPDFPPYRPEIAKFYESDGYALAWVHGGQPTPQALALISVLQQANSKGLNADDYDGPRWSDRVTKLGPSAAEPELIASIPL